MLETFQGHQPVEDDLESNNSPGAWQRVGARFQCPICGLTRNTKSQIQKHMGVHDEDEEDGSFTCNDCSYQTISRDQLIEHTEKTHTTNNNILKCDSCKLNFSNQKEMNIHNNTRHNKSSKPCRNFQTSNCEYDSECDFLHIILNQGEHICYKCGDILGNKTLLMTHISREHGEEPCKKFAANKCTFGNRCLFKHIFKPVNIVPKKQQDFHNSPQEKTQPPGGMQTMSEHIQNQQQVPKPHGVTPPMNIINMIPEIVSQVVTLLTSQMRQ